MNSKTRRKHAREKRKRERIHLEHQLAKPKMHGEDELPVQVAPIVNRELNNQIENGTRMRFWVATWKKIKGPFRFVEAHNGAITALATIVLGLLTFVYVRYTKGQWERMTEANHLAQTTFEVTQEASVTLGNREGVLAEFRNSHSPKVKDGLAIYFQNSGHMPAKFKWGINQTFVENPDTNVPADAPRFEPMMRTRNRKTGAITETWSTDGSIGGDSVREVAAEYLPPGFVDYLTASNRGFRVNGTFEYCDELGRYACRDFSLEYQHLPFGTFRIKWDNECVDRAYLGKTTVGPDEEQLPMCVPRNAPAFPNH